MENRRTNIEIVRFIAALIVMSHHLYHLGLQVGQYPFFTGWIAVELFLIITGYYTAKHFNDTEIEDSDNTIKISIEYTVNKFIKFMPLVIAAILLEYLTNALCGVFFGDWTFRDFIKSFLGDFSFEILLISESYTHPYVVPLWYISALFIVFPVFSIFMQWRNRYGILLFSFLYSIMYYGIAGITGDRINPQDLFRILAGLCLGAFVYEVSYLLADLFKAINAYFLSLLELLFFAVPVILIFMNSEFQRFVLLCFVFWAIIVYSNGSFSVKFKNRALNYLGSLSMPMFIFHWYVGTLVKGFGKIFEWSIEIKLILYYLLTLVISIIMMQLLNQWKWFSRLKSKGIYFKI